MEVICLQISKRRSPSNPGQGFCSPLAHTSWSLHTQSTFSITSLRRKVGHKQFRLTHSIRLTNPSQWGRCQKQQTLHGPSAATLLRFAVMCTFRQLTTAQRTPKVSSFRLPAKLTVSPKQFQRWVSMPTKVLSRWSPLASRSHPTAPLPPMEQ